MQGKKNDTTSFWGARTVEHNNSQVACSAKYWNREVKFGIGFNSTVYRLCLVEGGKVLGREPISSLEKDQFHYSITAME